MTMLERAIDEKRELDERIARLVVYIDSEEFKDISLLHRDLMNRQLGYMRAYSLTLRERIDDLQAKN
jgi:hypothetical protein